MCCHGCGTELNQKERYCPYCGKGRTEIISFHKKKKALLWVWSLALLFSMLALFTFFGQEILQFMTLLQDKVGTISPQLVSLATMHI